MVVLHARVQIQTPWLGSDAGPWRSWKMGVAGAAKRTGKVGATDSIVATAKTRAGAMDLRVQALAAFPSTTVLFYSTETQYVLDSFEFNADKCLCVKICWQCVRV